MFIFFLLSFSVQFLFREVLLPHCRFKGYNAIKYLIPDTTRTARSFQRRPDGQVFDIDYDYLTVVALRSCSCLWILDTGRYNCQLTRQLLHAAGWCGTAALGAASRHSGSSRCSVSCCRSNTIYVHEQSVDHSTGSSSENYRMAQTTQWSPAFLDYMKNVMSNISTLLLLLFY